MGLAGARPMAQLDAFTGWLAAFGDAWERRDADALAALFVVEASYQRTPFSELRRGRRAIRDEWAGRLVGTENVAFRAQVLGVGGTYAIAHYRVSERPAGGTVTRVEDGILLAALDARGRCTSLRRWAHDQEHSGLD